MLHKLAFLRYVFCYLCEFLVFPLKASLIFGIIPFFIPAHHGPKLYLAWTYLSILVLHPLYLDLSPYLDEKLSHSLLLVSFVLYSLNMLHFIHIGPKVKGFRQMCKE